MYERCLNEAELILSTQKIPLVSVQEVWEEVVRRSKVEGFEVASLIDFSTMLEGDRRFQIVPGQKKIQEEDEIPPESENMDEDMGSLGFFSEDRVRLRIARIVQPVDGEDEEEVGSIKRRAFVSKKENENELSVHGKSVKSTKKKSKKRNIKKTKPALAKKTVRKKTGTHKKSRKARRKK